MENFRLFLPPYEDSAYEAHTQNNTLQRCEIETAIGTDTLAAGVRRLNRLAPNRPIWRRFGHASIAEDGKRQHK
jgi:hypothetical protein